MNNRLRQSAIVSSLLLTLFSSTAFSAEIHRYTFNDGTANDSIGSDNGSLSSGAVIAGGQLQLDGVGGFVQFQNYLVPTSGSPFTVTFSAQRDLDPGTYTEIISQGSSGRPGFYVGQTPWGTVRGGDSWTGTGIAYPSDGQVHSFALSSSGTSASLYIDGQWMGTQPAYFSGSGGDFTRLGSQFGGYREFFPGKIDDVRIFNTALSAQEIGQIAVAAPIPEPETYAMMLAGLGLLGWLAPRRRNQRV